MFKTYRIGTLFGFPIEINLSFLLLLALALVWMGGVAGVLFVLIAFGSVLLHELGHALVARHLGVPIAGIELHFFGGAAKMMQQPRTASDEVAIAAAGPAVSFALGGLGMLLAAVTGSLAFQLIGWINVIIGAFNLIPALPMDGGRILRALLTRKLSYLRATETSILVARGFAVLLGLYALFSTQLYLAALAVMLWMVGSAELRVARAIAPSMAYGSGGYRRRDADEPELVPHWDESGRAGWRHGAGGPRPGSGGSRFVIRVRREP